MTTDTLFSIEATFSVPVGAAVLGRVLGTNGEPIDGRGPIVGATRRLVAKRPAGGAPDGAIFETGIKAIDLLAPIPRGGSLGIYAGPGLGKLVIMTEIIWRLARRGGVTICIGAEERTYEVSDLMRTMADAGLAASVAMVFTRIDEPAGAARRAILAGLTIAEAARDEGREALISLDRLMATPEEIAWLQGHMGAGITLMVNGPFGAHPGPVDAIVYGSPEHAARGIWPAIDRLRSASRLLEGGARPEPAAATAGLRELLMRAAREPELAARAELADQYLSQPFFCAEAYTDTPGEHVPIAVAVADLAAILSGEHDALPVEAARFTGALAPA
jgi:F-type H+-transporting ATPase subunit beta